MLSAAHSFRKHAASVNSEHGAKCRKTYADLLSLENYSQTLREADFITKQDAKDLTSWGGIRNHAAHGEWDEVSDKKRVSLMLEGVNLFMRKYGAGSS